MPTSLLLRFHVVPNKNHTAAEVMLSVLAEAYFLYKGVNSSAASSGAGIRSADVYPNTNKTLLKRGCRHTKRWQMGYNEPKAKCQYFN